jgi:hypothetical protein
MTTSALSSSLLEKYDSSVFAQQLFNRAQDETVDAASTEMGNLLSNVARATSTDDTRLQSLFSDLNAARTLQYGVTYDATGAALTNSNTILVGYG